jgi:hypothetical protein
MLFLAHCRLVMELYEAGKKAWNQPAFKTASLPLTVRESDRQG